MGLFFNQLTFMKRLLILLLISLSWITSQTFAEEDISWLDYSSLTQENLKICSQLSSGWEKTQCYNKIFKTFWAKNETQCLLILVPWKLRNILPRGNLTTDEYYNLLDSTFSLIQKYCSDKYAQRITYLTPTQKLEQEYDYKENKLYEQLKARPYGCIQPRDFEWPWAYIASLNRITTYENVCKNWMTDEEHEKAVKEFVPYLNSPAEFFDNTALWGTFYSDIIGIKTTNNWNIEEEVNNLITGLKKYKNTFIKSDISDKTLKEFFLKKAKEIDPVAEKKKQQAIKQKTAQEKRKQDKLLKDTIAPFAQYINTPYKQYFYNMMQEHYLKELANVNDPTQTSFVSLDEKNNAILATATEFADYILINWAINPEKVVKKWQEDNLREAIIADVAKRYSIR